MNATEEQKYTDQLLVDQVLRGNTKAFSAIIKNTEGLVIVLSMVFILTFVKWILDYRLKNRIIEKGIPENVASSILQTNVRNERNVTIKWFALLAAIGAGLTLVNFTLPVGIHSLAIMAFCLAAGFLGYYFLTRVPEKDTPKQGLTE